MEVSKPKICYVSAFLDIGRDEWKTFTRNFDDYLESFLPYIHLFKAHHDINIDRWCMVLYIDHRHRDRVFEKIKEIYKDMPIIIVSINETFLTNNIPLWNRLEREQEIMESLEYKAEFAHRLMFPENTNARYTLINHAKVDFVTHAICNIDETSDYFCWTDFGYFKNPNLTPHSLLGLKNFDLSRVNYTLINPLAEEDKDVLYTMHNAPEKIGGFFFFGNRQSLLSYRDLYHKVHENFQKQNLADDDQHLALRCYYKCPELFCLHLLGRWHMAHIHFQSYE